VGHHSEAFIGIDTSKSRNAAAIAEGGRGSEVRYLGELPTTEAATRKLVAKLAAKYGRWTFCYEAGPTAYGLYRLITSLGHECQVAVPSRTPKKPGDHVKTNRRDAVGLARLSRAGELTAVWMPDERHEAQGSTGGYALNDLDAVEHRSRRPIPFMTTELFRQHDACARSAAKVF
jgi:transposase